MAVSLDSISTLWWSAFDAAEAALQNADHDLTAEELRDQRSRLASERDSVVHLLDEIARTRHVAGRFAHLLIPRASLHHLLGLAPGVTACVFDLEGVLIGSASLHAQAWAETFDGLIQERIERTGGRFAPFNVRTDYWSHIHGKPRLEGVRAFLASRGISLPEGSPADPAGAETVQGLANRKRDVLARRLDEQGVKAYEGSRRYLEAAREGGIHRAVVSASANTQTILERAGLDGLVEQSVDGNTILAERLRPLPEPDLLLAACRELGVAPEHAAVFETSPEGIAAARAAGFRQVIGVGQEAALRAAGADLVIAGIADLLDRGLEA